MTKVRACLRLLTTEEGGRRSPIGSGYRPNHNFGEEGDHEFHIGQITLSGASTMGPGTTQEVIVEFIPSEGLQSLLKVGRTWRIQEAQRLIGIGEVLEVLSQRLTER